MDPMFPLSVALGSTKLLEGFKRLSNNNPGVLLTATTRMELLNAIIVDSTRLLTDLEVPPPASIYFALRSCQRLIDHLTQKVNNSKSPLTADPPDGVDRVSDDAMGLEEANQALNDLQAQADTLRQMATDAAQFNLVQSHLLRLEGFFFNRLCDSLPAIPNSQDTATILREFGHRKETAGRALFALCGFVFFGPEQVLRPVRIQIDPHLEFSLVNEALCALSDLGETPDKSHSSTLSTSIGLIKLEKRVQLDWSFEKSNKFKRDFFYILKDADFDLTIGQDILQSSAEVANDARTRVTVPANSKIDISSLKISSAEQNAASPQLDQFIREIAAHLIDEYEPKHSVGISPRTMQTFYQNHKIPDDIYPWQFVFDNDTSEISLMLQELGVPHFLTQTEVSKHPETPALPVRGFEQWEWLLINAYPVYEYERLSKVVETMSFASLDKAGTKSLLHELGRRLLSIQPNMALAVKIREAVSRHCYLPSNIPNETQKRGPPQRDPYIDRNFRQGSITDFDRIAPYFLGPTSQPRRFEDQTSEGSYSRTVPHDRVHVVRPRTSDELLRTHRSPKISIQR